MVYGGYFLFVLVLPLVQEKLSYLIAAISVLHREITLTISDSIETVSPVESEKVRVVSFRTTEITEIYRICHELTVEIKFYKTSFGKCY